MIMKKQNPREELLAKFVEFYQEAYGQELKEQLKSMIMPILNNPEGKDGALSPQQVRLVEARLHEFNLMLEKW